MQQSKEDISLGRFISRILRHDPGAIGITLCSNGWASVDALIAGICRSGKCIDREMLERIVCENNKNRYSFSADKSKIRANQGHSIAVDVQLKEAIPEGNLYHGTAVQFLDSMRKDGITKQKRRHCHLSAEYQTATQVGRRHGKAAVLTINTAQMSEDGYKFYLSENGVWLCDHIPWIYVAAVEVVAH